MIDLAQFAEATLAVLQRAKAIAAAMNGGVLTGPPPHTLLLALLSRDDEGGQLAQTVADGDAPLLHTLQAALTEAPGPPPSQSVEPPAATVAVLIAAQDLARASRLTADGLVQLLHLWCAVLESDDPELATWLEQHGLERATLVAASRRALQATRHATPAHPLPEPARQVLARFCDDLTALADAGKLRPAIGRRQIFERLCEQLLRLGKRNVVLTGEGGVGKTFLVRHLAWTLTHEPATVPAPLHACRVYSLDLLRLRMGGGVVGELEARTRDLISVLERYGDRIILFIDEMHVIVGSAIGGSALDLANALKPLLAEGTVRCIGATTPAEYNRYIESDPALARRFAELRVPALGREETLELLRAERGRFEGTLGCAIDDTALRAVVDLAQRYLPNRQFPDKGVDLLDAACAHAVFQRAERVTAALVKGVLARDLGLPEVDDPEMTAARIEQALMREVVGQRAPIAAIARALVRGFRLPPDHTTPRAVLLLTGPSRVGKTLAAQSIGNILCARPDQFLRLDMSEFVGAAGGHGAERAAHRLLGPPPPYVGYERGGLLTNHLLANPASVILLDEFEKADRQVQDIFLGIFDRGTVLDGLGRTVSCRDCYFVLTSNALAGSEGRARSGEGALRQALLASGALRGEFLNRLSAVIAFAPLDAPALEDLARRAWDRLQRECLQDYGVPLRAVPDLHALFGTLARVALGERAPAAAAIGFVQPVSSAHARAGDAQALTATFQSQVATPVRDTLDGLCDDAPVDWIEARVRTEAGVGQSVEVRAVTLVPDVRLVEGSPAEAEALARLLPHARWQAVAAHAALDMVPAEAVPVVVIPAGRADLAATLRAGAIDRADLHVVLRVERAIEEAPAADPPALHIDPGGPLDRIDGYLTTCLARARALQRRRRLLELLDRFEAEGREQDEHVRGMAPLRAEGGMRT